jgi:hypothetical protein
MNFKTLAMGWLKDVFLLCFHKGLRLGFIKRRRGFPRTVRPCGRKRFTLGLSEVLPRWSRRLELLY